MIFSIKYTDQMADNQAGYARAWFVRIRPKYKDDKGLHNHELTHVAQFWKMFGLHSLMYLASKKYRLKAEVEAYKEQLKYNPEHKDLYADFICKNYGLDVSKEEVLKLLYN